MRIPVVVIATTWLVSALPAQTLPVQRLAGREAAGTEFSSITALRELSDGRVLVADGVEKQLTMLTSSLRIARTIGRVGEGPGEFKGLASLSAMHGDTTLLYDHLNQRFTVIHPDGTPGTTIPEQAVRATRIAMTGPGGGRPLQVSPQRRYCVIVPELPRGMAVPKGPQGQNEVRSAVDDSSTVGCGALDDAAPTTLTRLRRPATRPIGDPELRAFGPVLFDKADGWAMAPSGDVAVVRSDPYRVEWHRAGRLPLLGPAIPWTPGPVTKNELDRIHRTRKARLLEQDGKPRVAPDGSGHGTTPAARLADIPLPSATTKPPFQADGIVAGPGNELWVLRHGVDGALPRYDVFNAQGQRIRQVELDDGLKVIAVGARHIYTVRVDDDGLHHLERWNRPT